MKGFGRKIIFGIPMTIALLFAGLFMLVGDNRNENFIPIVFSFAFAVGIIFWMYLNSREMLRRKEENFRRKHK